MAGGDPRIWGLLLLGLLVGLVPVLAAAALVRHLSQSRDNGHKGAPPRAQACSASSAFAAFRSGMSKPSLNQA